MIPKVVGKAGNMRFIKGGTGRSHESRNANSGIRELRGRGKSVCFGSRDSYVIWIGESLFTKSFLPVVQGCWPLYKAVLSICLKAFLACQSCREHISGDNQAKKNWNGRWTAEWNWRQNSWEDFGTLKFWYKKDKTLTTEINFRRTKPPCSLCRITEQEC